MIVMTKKKLKFMNHNFIAIEGNIGVGKTSLARMISEDYNSKLCFFIRTFFYVRKISSIKDSMEW